MTSGQGYKAKPTAADRARRRNRASWIVTAVIGAIIVVAIVIAVAVHASGQGKTVVLGPGDTHFTKAGIAKMTRGADAQIDVIGARPASAVQLPADGSRTFGPFENIEAELDLVGKHGIDSLFVDTFTVKTSDDLIRTISTKTAAYSYTDIHNALENDVVVGISPRQMAAFENAMPNGAGDPSSHFSLVVGTGYDLGVPTKVAVKCAGVAGCTITTLTTLAG